jgi:mRNA interferase HigB
VNVISRKLLAAFWAQYPDAKDAPEEWYRAALKANWEGWSDVQGRFPKASYYQCCLIFNICGNKYRLVVRRSARWKRLYVVGVFTHGEYDRGTWKGRCA